MRVLKSHGLRILLGAKGNSKTPPEDDVTARMQVSWLMEVRKGEFAVKELKTTVKTSKSLLSNYLFNRCHTLI